MYIRTSRAAPVRDIFLNLFAAVLLTDDHDVQCGQSNKQKHEVQEHVVLLERGKWLSVSNLRPKQHYARKLE